MYDEKLEKINSVEILGDNKIEDNYFQMIQGYIFEELKTSKTDYDEEDFEEISEREGDKIIRIASETVKNISSEASSLNATNEISHGINDVPILNNSFGDIKSIPSFLRIVSSSSEISGTVFFFFFFFFDLFYTIF
jgi:hypothetical protein